MLRKVFILLFAVAGGPAVLVITVWLRLQGWSATEAFIVTIIPITFLIFACFRIVILQMRKFHLEAKARYEEKMWTPRN